MSESASTTWLEDLDLGLTELDLLGDLDPGLLSWEPGPVGAAA
jgi:hypothetical protein